ncbi:MAG TPA: sigma-70 family RNA polymerase sigma factor [Bacteroidales bacterium]|nr:sigma-70 family RNA polymerase sigma factor [Bacteroidales bacterium]
MDVAQNLTPKGKRDYQYIQRALHHNDQLAYECLLNHYRDAVYFLMLRMCGNHDDAEDLTIEAFGKAFSKLHQYSPDYGFSTWLFRIAANNAIDFKRRTRIKQVSIEAGTETSPVALKQMADSEPDPENKLILDQQVKLMRQLVAKLRPRYRNLIELRYFDELSYEEIAQRLNLPLGTVKAQLFRAREFLIHIMRDSIGNY